MTMHHSHDFYVHANSNELSQFEVKELKDRNTIG